MKRLELPDSSIVVKKVIKYDDTDRPSATSVDMYLGKGVDIGGGGGVNVVQTTGTSTTDVMSQNAVSSIIGDTSVLYGLDVATAISDNTNNIMNEINALGQLRQDVEQRCYGYYGMDILPTTPTQTTTGKPGFFYLYDTTGSGNYEVWLCLAENYYDNTYVWKQVSLT